ncbi:MAG: hypothetical protein GYA17_09365 [Chloroflexi bacterium]|nr:hypothetical protein [Anaerolineaceae bacterium]NMB88557.1 hypothetical protein [Chloroflexota bacterium]
MTQPPSVPTPPGGPPKVIRKIIRRQYAEKYLLLTLFSFAISISCTRLFLELTGYPQIGNGELHIAHVLWGGLILFAAALLPIIFTNQWIYTWTAILSGVGVGLFIDEVGKFITQSNDYFYPAAAPIVYVFFLITVLVYVMVRRKNENNTRADLYYILQDLEEVIDHDLSPGEKERIHQRLRRVAANSPHTDIHWLAQSLAEFISRADLYLAPESPTVWQRVINWLSDVEARYLSERRYRAILAGSLIAVGMWALAYPISVLSTARDANNLALLLNHLVVERLVRGSIGVSLFQVRVGMEGSIGLILLLSAVLLAYGDRSRALLIGYAGLLFSLTVVQPLLFYFDQFSSIINASVQFLIFLGAIHYRQHYLIPPDEHSPYGI